MPTTDMLENALAFAASDVHSGDTTTVLWQAHAACKTLAREIERLKKIEHAASVTITTCRAGMEPLIEDGIRSMTFAAASNQFAAAWRELQRAVETKGAE